MAARHFKPEQVIEALRQTEGKQGAAAALLGCHPTTLLRYIKQFPEVKAAHEECIAARSRAERYRPEEVIAALERAKTSRASAARMLGCSRSLLAGYAERYPEVRAAYEACGRAQADSRRYGPEDYIRALQQTNGIKSRAAAILGCTTGTVSRAIDRDESVRTAYEAMKKEGMTTRRYRPEQVADALREAGGRLKGAAAILGCEWHTVLKYTYRYPEVDEAYRTTPKAPAKLERYRPEVVAEALRRSGGIKSHAARRLGCWRNTVDDYIKRHPEVREAWEESRAVLVDKAESKLVEAVDRGVWQAVRYTLSTLGKDRGYTLKANSVPKLHEDEAYWAALREAIRKAYGISHIPGVDDEADVDAAELDAAELDEAELDRDERDEDEWNDGEGEEEKRDE